MLVKEIINPGGISHHQYPRISADAACASCSICPQVGKARVSQIQENLMKIHIILQLEQRMQN